MKEKKELEITPFVLPVRGPVSQTWPCHCARRLCGLCSYLACSLKSPSWWQRRGYKNMRWLVPMLPPEGNREQTGSG